MEADAGVELINHSKILERNGLRVGCFIGDEDSSTTSAVAKVNPDATVHKIADKNQLVKNFRKELYQLAKTYKEL